MKKKYIGIFLVQLICFVFLMPMVFANYQLTLLIGNQKITHKQQQPLVITYNNQEIKGDMPAIIREDRTLVPVRSTFEKMESTVSWDEKNKQVTISSKNQNVVLQVNNSIAKVNGKDVKLDVPAQMIGVQDVTDGLRVMVPLRFVSEVFQKQVTWDPKQYAVHITSNDPIKEEPVKEEPVKEEPVSPTLNKLKEISYGQKTEYSEILIKTQNKLSANYKVASLNEGIPRIFVDIPNTEISNVTAPATMQKDNILKVRTGQNGHETRIVLELNTMANYKLDKLDDHTLSLKVYYKKISNLEVKKEANKESATLSFEKGISYGIDKLEDEGKVWIDFHAASSTLGVIDQMYKDYSYLKKARAYQHEGFYRVVFEMEKGSSYEVISKDNQITFEFSKNSSIENPENLQEITYLKLAKHSLILPKNIVQKLEESQISYSQNLKEKLLVITLSKVKIPEKTFLPGDERIEKIEVKEKGENTEITVYGKSILEYSLEEEENMYFISFLRPKEKYDKILILDPGHGGWDPGAVGNGMKERDITLDVGLMTKNLLKDSGIKVYMTREINMDLGAKAEDLYGRAKIANDIGGDLFISIHTNAFNGKAYGTETYYFTNEVNYGNYNGKKAATIIQKEVLKALGTFDRGVKSANYVVIRETKMPAILLEGAFIDNASDAAKLKTPEYRLKQAQAIATGVKKIFEEYKPVR